MKRSHEDVAVPLTATGTASAGGVRCEVSIVERGPRGRICTGICFLDHMIDQLTAHGQLGVSVGVSRSDGGNGAGAFAPNVDYAGGAREGRVHDSSIAEAAGEALGAALGELLSLAAQPPDGELLSRGAAPRGLTSARFFAPLDEALAEVEIVADAAGSGGCALELSQAPYGDFPPGGREWIGCLRVSLLASFWERLCLAARLERLSIRKVRGANAHHIVESSFKAFARAYRALLDALRARASGEAVAMEGGNGRTGATSRETKETTISISLDLDARTPPSAGGAPFPAGGAPPAYECVRVCTGLSSLDAIFTELFGRAQIGLSAYCKGDLYVDDHHTSEDVAIAAGQCMHAALGSKAGCVRMGYAEGCCGGARVVAVVDLSNRPHFEHNLRFRGEFAGDMSCEMLEHAFASLTTEARITVHVLQLEGGAGADGPSALDLAIATARAYGAALKATTAIDPRRAGQTASSKGTLSA